MNTVAMVWDPEALPYTEVSGFPVVKGTNSHMPEENPPTSMYEALLDQRSVFDQIRYGHMECQGGNLIEFQKHFLYVIENYATDLCHRREIQTFLNVIASVVTKAHGHVSPPPNFMDLVWPHYLHGYLHGHLGCQYWLSYDELLALATIAKVNLVIVEEREGCFHYIGDNLACVADANQRIVISSIRGGGEAAVESHFERLMPIAEEAQQELNNGRLDTTSTTESKPLHCTPSAPRLQGVLKGIESGLTDAPVQEHGKEIKMRIHNKKPVWKKR